MMTLLASSAIWIVCASMIIVPICLVIALNKANGKKRENVQAHLQRHLTNCPHCGSKNLKYLLHRWISDVEKPAPYDDTKWSSAYRITEETSLYLFCQNCGKESDSGLPSVTQSRCSAGTEADDVGKSLPPQLLSQNEAENFLIKAIAER